MTWKVALAILAALALFLLTMKSRVRGADEYLETTNDVRALHELNARLDRSALEAESGLVLNYDPINVTLREMSRRQTVVERSTASLDDPEIRRRIDVSAKSIRTKEALLEAFESRNSVFRNSLSYLPVAAKAAATETSDSPVGARVGDELSELLANVFCRSQCDEAALARLRVSIAALSETRALVGPNDQRLLDLTLRHAAVFADYSPKVNKALADVLADDGRPYEDLFVALQAFHERAATRAEMFRALLLFLCVGLGGLVVSMVNRIRQNARALGRALGELALEKRVVDEKRIELAELNQSLETRVLERTKELARSHEQYRLLLESSRAIPWEMRPGSTTFSYVGRHAETALGLPTSEWMSEGFLETRLRPEDRERTLARLSDEHEYAEIEFAAEDSDGQAHWFRCYVTKSTDSDGQIVRRGLLFDISKQRILEGELRASQKLQGIGRLASGIAHEINTPVQFVGDNVSFLSDAFRDLSGLIEKYRALIGTNETIRAAEETADLDFILSNVPETLRSSTDGLQRIASIVRSMKEFAHPDRKEKVHVDLNSNIQSTLTIARNEYKHVADVCTDFGALPPVLCHPGEVNQVVLNIIVNAAHAVADLVQSSGKLGRIEIATRMDGTYALITIRDTGGGIPTKHRDHIFEPFFTTKEVGRGTGQGLAIARSIIVDKHHGEISFETELGVGTTFSIRLPVEAEAAIEKDAA